jgi:hypothetical protein
MTRSLHHDLALKNYETIKRMLLLSGGTFLIPEDVLEKDVRGYYVEFAVRWDGSKELRLCSYEPNLRVPLEENDEWEFPAPSPAELVAPQGGAEVVN